MSSAPVTRAALAGALGGMAAGALEVALAFERVQAFLPSGRGKLLVFACALYAAAGALVGLIIGAVAALLGRASDLGAWWHAAFGPTENEPREGRRVAAYALAVAAALVGLGRLVQPIALDALGRYHHRLLLSSLVGASAAGLAIALAAVVFLLATVLSPVLPLGPRVRLRFSAPLAWEAALWALGLYAGAGAVSALLYSLLERPRMPAALKALNTGIWAPVLIAIALTLSHGLARVGWRLLGSERLRARLSSPTALTLALTAALGLPLLLATASQWATVKQLDARPWLALAFGLAVALTAALALRYPFKRMTPIARLLLSIGLVALPLVLALPLGRADRVRKAAVSQTGLSGPLVRAIQAATDLDRDGYSSVLGGGDCNDLDPDVHPGAFDWPDDGIDQDCNGHQASLTPPAPRPWAAVPPTLPKAPNVVLITIDALRADHVGSYGYARPTTPNLDALTRESVRFSYAWAHAPSTRYSVPAILTGRYPSTIAVGNAWWPPNLLPEDRLVGEMLKDLGYHTGAMLSYYYFNRAWGLDQGIDDYDIHLQTLHSMGGDPSKTQGTSARQLADLDVEYIAKHRGEKFFLWTHFYDTHFGFERHPDCFECNFGNDEIALYDGEIRFTDLHIGRVLQALKDAGIWDNTIVIVTSDHGDGFGEHGLPQSQRHGYHLYRNETKVPLIVHLPGVQPRVVDEPVGHIDILPTLINALGRPQSAEPTLLGSSLLGLMLGQPAAEPRKVYQEVWYEGPTSRKGVVTRDWHLIRNLVPDDTTELYDEKSDPEEEHDRAGEGLDAERALRIALAEWMDAAALPAGFHDKVEGNLSTAPLPFQHKLGDSFSGWLTLEGADAPATAKAGDTFEVALLWHATGGAKGSERDGWRVFTHVIAPDGRRLNLDHDPLEGLYPLKRMREGQWVRDRVKVTLPPNWPRGPLHVDVGLWKSPERAPVSGPDALDGAVRAATVEVGG